MEAPVDVHRFKPEPLRTTGDGSTSESASENELYEDTMDLSCEQLDIVSNKNPTFIQGRGGTGKTTTLVMKAVAHEISYY
eukprot:GSA120T00004800001.1